MTKHGGWQIGNQCKQNQRRHRKQLKKAVLQAGRRRDGRPDIPMRGFERPGSDHGPVVGFRQRNGRKKDETSVLSFSGIPFGAVAC
jgi:hypothetical protein